MIYEDTRQQNDYRGDKHAKKHEWWAAHGVKVVRKTLKFGDYSTIGSNIVVDTKRNIEEIAQNISRDHRRFANECKEARDAGYRLIVLIEQRNGYKKLADVARWTNTHCVRCQIRARGGCNPHVLKGKCERHGTRRPIQGVQLYKAMQTMTERYGVRFVVCKPTESARMICEYLGVEHD